MMKRALVVLIVAAALLFAVVGSKFDFTLGTTPGNPPAGKVRLWSNSGTGYLECLSATGTNCFAPSASLPGLTALSTITTPPTFTAASTVADTWSMTLGANIASSTLSGATSGEHLVFNICQDGTGARTFAWPTGFTSAAPILPTASKCTKEEFVWDGSAANLVAVVADAGPTLYSGEQSAAGTPAANYTACWADSTDHAGLECKANNSANVFKMLLSGVDVTPTTGVVAGLGGAAFTGMTTGSLKVTNGTGAITTIPNTRALGCILGDVATGSALTTSEVCYITSPYACTITGWHIMADGGTATVKTWRINAGTALPTVSNSISTSGVALASGTKIDSTTVSDFTSVAIAANDTLGFSLYAVATAKQITFQLDCVQ